MSNPSTIRVQCRLLRTGVCAAALMAVASCSTMSGSGYPYTNRLDTARFSGPTPPVTLSTGDVVRGLVSGEYAKMTPRPVELGIPSVDKGAPTLFDPAASTARMTSDTALATLAGLRLRTGDTTLPPPFAPQLAVYDGADGWNGGTRDTNDEVRRPTASPVANWFARNRARLHDGLTAVLSKERGTARGASDANPTGPASTDSMATGSVRPLYIKVPSATARLANDARPAKPGFWSWVLRGGDVSRPLPARNNAKLAATSAYGIDPITTASTGAGPVPVRGAGAGAVADGDTSATERNTQPAGSGQIPEHTQASDAQPGDTPIVLPTSDLGKVSGRTLTLREAVETTLNTNPDVGIARAREQDARAGIKIAKAGYMPQVDLEVSSGEENIYSETDQELFTQRSEASLQVNQTIYDFGKTRGAVGRREALYESAVLRRQDKSEEVAFDVVSAYLEVLKQSDLAAAARRNVKSHTDMARLIGISEEEGNATLADVKRVQTRLDSAKSAVLDIENNQQTAMSAFKRITDIDARRLKRPKSISAALGRVKKSDIDLVARNNHALRAVVADQESLDQQFLQQRAKRYPELFASAQANYKDNLSGPTGTNMDMRAMVGFRVKLFDGGTRSGTEEQIRARQLETKLRYQKTYRELVQNLDDNAQSIHSSDEKAKFLSDSVSAARKVVSLSTDLFRNADKSPFELLDAQLDLYKAEVDLIGNRYDAATATFSNLRLRGELVGYLARD